VNDYTKEQWAAIERRVNSLNEYLEASQKVQEATHKVIAATENVNGIYEERLCPVEREVKSA
jgi:hypothetical protein